MYTGGINLSDWQRTAATRPKLLFISGFYPNNSAPSSGQKLVFAEIDKLRSQYDVHLVSFINKLERPFADRSTVEHLVESCAVFNLNTRNRVIAALRYPGLPLLASARQLAARHVRNLIATIPFERIVIEFTQAASIVPPEAFDRVEFVAHDVAYQAYERRATQEKWWKRLAYSFELIRLRRWEQGIVRRARWVTVLNAKDEQILRRDVGRTDIVIRYPELPDYLRGVLRSPEKVERGHILFWGHMARVENVDAMVWFTQEVFPLVLDQCPDARLVIAGAAPTSRVERMAGQNVVVTGYIEDPTELFEQTQIAIAPLRYGGGIKIKTLETTMLGIDTVATQCGAEGVRQNGRLHIADDAAGFASEVIRLLSRSKAANTETSKQNETSR
jgi:polysaccharide biosynthesis protein PslH